MWVIGIVSLINNQTLHFAGSSDENDDDDSVECLGRFSSTSEDRGDDPNEENDEDIEDANDDSVVRAGLS